MNLSERRNEDAIICENKKVRDLAKWNEENCNNVRYISGCKKLSSHRTNVASVMNGELCSTAFSLIMYSLRPGIALRPVTALFSFSLSLIL
jgi:hypothetical protein